MAKFLMMSFFALLITGLIFSIPSVSAWSSDRRFRVGEYMPVFADKIISDSNRCKELSYFDLPFCPPGRKLLNRQKSLEELLQGDCFINTQYEIRFKIERIGKFLCEKSLTKDEVRMFRDAVIQRSEYELSFDDISHSIPIGKASYYDGPKYYLFPHIIFDAYYEEDRLKDMQIRRDVNYVVDITEDSGIKVNFTYSVFWNYTKLSDDLEIEEDQNPDPELSITRRIIVLALLAIMFVEAFHEFLRYYITRAYNGDQRNDDAQQNLQPFHGDGCRCPPYPTKLGAFLANGTQLLILIFTAFWLAYRGALYSCDLNRMITSLLLIYILTSAICGGLATSFYGRYVSAEWTNSGRQTASLYLVPAWLSFIGAYIVSEIRRFMNAPPDEPKIDIFLLLTSGISSICFLITGGMIGHALRRNPPPPCATREIPSAAVQELPWYTNRYVQVFLGGLLPFMTIFWEMDKIYASLWTYAVCGALSTMTQACIHVTTMTILVGMGFTAIQLSKQDQDWWWISVFRGGSTAIFMFFYGVYFHARVDSTAMSAMTVMRLNSLIFYAIFLALGTVGFFASYLVFRFTYRTALKRE